MTEPRATLLHELTREGCHEAAGRNAIVLLPVGATEQHGPHLPVGTDTFHVERVARDAAAVAGERVLVVVAPTLAYGCSQHHVAFGGTASLSTETFLAVLLDVGRSLLASGFRRLFFLNGHGGNHELVQLAARDLALANDADVAAASWWHLAVDAFVEAGALERGRVPGHAGSFETALVLALRPDLVVDPPMRERTAPPVVALRDPLRIERHGSWQAIEGWTDSPSRGNAEHGRWYLELGVAAVVAAIERFATATDRDA